MKHQDDWKKTTDDLRKEMQKIKKENTDIPATTFHIGEAAITIQSPNPEFLTKIQVPSYRAKLAEKLFEVCTENGIIATEAVSDESSPSKDRAQVLEAILVAGTKASVDKEHKCIFYPFEKFNLYLPGHGAVYLKKHGGSFSDMVHFDSMNHFVDHAVKTGLFD
jgi:hypothetical protein